MLFRGLEVTNMWRRQRFSSSNVLNGFQCKYYCPVTNKGVNLVSVFLRIPYLPSITKTLWRKSWSFLKLFAALPWTPPGPGFHPLPHILTFASKLCSWEIHNWIAHLSPEGMAVDLTVTQLEWNTRTFQEIHLPGGAFCHTIYHLNNCRGVST